MSQNIMSEYIEYTRNFIHQLMKEYFKDKYSKEIVEEYIEVYIDARYNNYGGNEGQRVFYRRIYSALKKKEEELSNNADEENKKNISNILETFQYVFYIDFVREIKIDLREFVNQMYEKRITKFEMKRDGSLRDNLYKMIKNFREEKEKYLKSFETEDFELVTIKYPLIKDIYKVDLKYNFKLPYIYSKEAINDVYNEKVINEDKLIIQYLLLTVFNIRMILEGKFNTQYLVDLPITILEKNQKLQKILKIIDNPAIQDRVKIKIKYRDFVLHKTEIYNLMQNGYRFAIIIDDSFVCDEAHIKKLEIFDYVILNKEIENSENFKKYTKQLENIILDEG